MSASSPAPTPSRTESGPIASPPAPARELTYVVSGMSCDHCIASVSEEVGALAGVEAVHADLETKLVRVRGAALDDVAVRAAIETAGYEGVPA
jgi:copper chaperone